MGELPAFCDTPVETLVETYFGEQPLTQGEFEFGMMKLKAVSSLESFCAMEEKVSEDEVTEETEETESEKTLEAIAKRLLKSKSDKKSRKSDKESDAEDKRE